jgi:hypothetical protein
LAKRFSSDRMKQLARMGAAARVAELQEEIASIRGAFPGLGGGARRERATSADSQPPRRKRRSLSAKARAAISAAQKKRWAKVRAAKDK